MLGEKERWIAITVEEAKWEKRILEEKIAEIGKKLDAINAYLRKDDGMENTDAQFYMFYCFRAWLNACTAELTPWAASRPA